MEGVSVVEGDQVEGVGRAGPDPDIDVGPGVQISPSVDDSLSKISTDQATTRFLPLSFAL